MLGPILEKVCRDQGVELVKVNTDKFPDLAVQFGVTALPTVKVISQGKVVDGFIGLKDAKALTDLVGKHRK